MTEESARIRLAFEVDDSARTTDALEAAGARVIAPPVMTPWRSLNARLEAPADLQITLFQETVTTEQRATFPVSKLTTAGRFSRADPTVLGPTHN